MGSDGGERHDVSTVSLGAAAGGEGASPLAVVAGERYVLLDPVGKGGSATVYSAYDRKLDRKIALKLLHRDLGPAQTRLVREAQALARLRHPNVVTVFDIGTFEGRAFVAMELVDGQSLRAWLAERSRSWREVVPVLLAAGRGLAAAHDERLVHRDFKPDNVLIGDDGTVRVADFGLVRLAGEAEPAADAGDESPLAAHVTRTGAVIGTPRYMPPEQRAGGAVDARGDQFAFCATLYEALFGRPAFAGDDAGAIAAAIAAGRVAEPPRGSRVPAWLAAIVRRGLAPRPEQRHPSMRALLAELGRDRGRARRRWMVTAAVAMLVPAALVARRRLAAPACAGGGALVAPLWGEAARARVAQAFRATGRLYAGEAFAGVDRILHARLDAWAAGHRDACEATRVRGEQSEQLLDLRDVCLDERRAETRDLIAVFERADAVVVERAVAAAEALPEIRRCADLRAVAARVAPPPPALVAGVAALRAILGQGVALHRAGRDRDGELLVSPVVPAAVGLGYAPLAAEARATSGELAQGNGRGEPAAESLSRAYFEARRAGDDAVATRAASDLVEVEGSALSRFAEANVWIELASAEVARSGRGTRDEARLLLRIADVRDREGRLDDAAGDLRAADVLVDALDERESVLAADLLMLEGTNQRHRGEHRQALATLERQLVLAERVYGPEHPSLITSLTSLAYSRSASGHELEGIATLREALALSERVRGPRHPQTINSHVALGLVLFNRAEYKAAIAEYEGVEPLAREVFGAEHTKYADLLDNLAIAYVDVGRLDDALTYARRALAIEEARYGPENVNLAWPVSHIGTALMMKQRCGEAIPHLQHAIALLERGAPGSEARYYPMADLGQCLLDLGRPKDAIPILEEVLARFENEPSRTEPLANARMKLAMALWDGGGDRRRAVALMRKAQEAYASLGPDAPTQPRELADWFRRHRVP